jgi:zinc protease
VPRRDVPDRVRLQEPEQTAARRVEVESARAGQPQIVIRYLAPGARLAEPGRDHALQVLSEVLGGGTTSRLYSSLVVEQGLAASAGTFYDADTYDMGSFGFYAAPRPGIDVDDVETALRAEIARVIEEGAPADAVAEAKHRLRAQVVYARDSVNTAPRVIGSTLVTGQTLEELEAWPERIAAVTPEDVRAAAKAVMVEAHSVTSVLRSKPTS